MRAVRKDQVLDICRQLSARSWEKPKGEGAVKAQAENAALMKRLLDALACTREDLSKAAGVTKQTVDRWMNGAVRPQPRAIEEIREFALKREAGWARNEVDPRTIGVLTWSDWKEQIIERGGISVLWLFSRDRFLEADGSTSVADEMEGTLRAQAHDAIYVFPKETEAQASFREWRTNLESADAFDHWSKATSNAAATPGDSPGGHVIGICVTEMHKIPMFIKGTYAVIVERAVDGDTEPTCDGYLAFMVDREVLRQIANDSQDDEPQMVWVKVAAKLTKTWWSAYCRRLRALIGEKAQEGKRIFEISFPVEAPAVT
jgi:transcriptional regulator with XRE-family HTH domain